MPAGPSSILQPVVQEQKTVDPAIQAKIDQANAILAAGNYPNNAMQVSSDFAQKNPDFTPQQLANGTVTNYWSNESEAYSRVINAANTSPDKLKFIQDENGLALTTGEHPGYDTLYLQPTGQPGVYQFSTYNQVAGGNIHGIIGADPSTGKVVPVVDAAKQFAYTPGSSGSFFGNLIGSFGDMFKGLGPLGVVLGNLALPGLGTGLGIAAAIDEGNAGGALTSLATGAALGQLGLPGAISEATGSDVLGQVGSNTIGGLVMGQDLNTALTNAAIASGAQEITNQTPADFQADVENVLDSTAGVPVSAFEQDINQVLDMPATPTPEPSIFVDTTAPELPSGMDLAADSTPGTANTLEDIAAALGGEGTAISGQDLAADATPGNTLEDVSTALTPTVTPTTEPKNLTADQLASLIKTGLGLFGGVTAASKALGGLTGGGTTPIAQPTPITPFTGTYSGLNLSNPEYFQQVQQNYNRLFPTTPANVQDPLQAWYATKFIPDTSVTNKLFGV